MGLRRPRRHTGIAPDGSLMRNAPYPGYRNAKEAARGGTRREVAKEQISRRITRRPKKNLYAGKGEAIAKEQEDNAKGKGQ